MTTSHRPTVLIILDGFGYKKSPEHNAIYHAKTPFWDKAWETGTKTLLSGSGHHVGLPKGQMGNSEVGHLNMGAGRVIPQDFTRIDTAIKNGSFQKNAPLNNAIDNAIKNDKAVHILGLLSEGGVHSHETQIHAAIKLAAKRGATKIYLHAFLDGRDTPPRSAKSSLEKMEKLYETLGCGRTVSLIGRYYAMDRDNRWERISQAYDLLTQGTAICHAVSAIDALEAAYVRDESDEFVQASSIHATNEKAVTIGDDDAVIFMNYRADRARELTRALTHAEFTQFKRHAPPKLADFVTLTEYDKRFSVSVAFPALQFKNVLGEYISNLGLRQLRIAETEKYAHVTFFFNGGIEQPFPQEDRLLIPSPKVATYDLQPEMNAPLLTNNLIEAITSHQYDLIICNFANADMVGHTGNFDATVKAIETLDQCLEKIANTLQTEGGELVITADHGNAECMYNPNTKQAHTAHTCGPVPFVYIGRPATLCYDEGTLSDIAPTLLALMGLDKPSEMTGQSLIQLTE